MYCNGWRPKSDHLRHEVLLTDFLVGYPEGEVKRGWKVDRHVRPDAEVVLNQRKFFVEMDTGEVSLPRYRDRQKSYLGVGDFLLVVTLSERRMANLIASSDAIKSIALFTTLARAIENPRGEIWVDCFGRSASI